MLLEDNLIEDCVGDGDDDTVGSGAGAITGGGNGANLLPKDQMRPKTL